MSENLKELIEQPWARDLMTFVKLGAGANRAKADVKAVKAAHDGVRELAKAVETLYAENEALKEQAAALKSEMDARKEMEALAQAPVVQSLTAALQLKPVEDQAPAVPEATNL